MLVKAIRETDDLQEKRMGIKAKPEQMPAEENDTAGEILHQWGMQLQTSFPKWGRTSLGNLVVILDLKLRPTTCTALDVAAAPCLLSALVAYMY